MLETTTHEPRNGACAPAQNTMHVQQQSMARFIDINQKAAAMMGSAFADAWTVSGQARH